ncbi:MAG TPA: alkaline phosphatase family protein [Chloroflexota bacterium]|nr:alkaline phosphatase family protein [Chloroflexota bacterium]
MGSPAKRAIVIGMDGASMELVKNMIKWGHVPNIKRVLESGVHRPMIGVFPTLTPPGWTAISTGSWPGTHQVMDFNIRALGQPLTETIWGINTRLSKSEYLWNTIERAGKKPILVKWEMSWPPTVKDGIQVEGTGPGVSNHHQIAGYHLFVGGKWAPRPIGGDRDPETLDPSALQEGAPYDVVTIKEAKEWSNLPGSQRPPLEVELTIKPLARGRDDMNRGKVGVPKTYYGLIYASRSAGYDRVRIANRRDASDPIADLGVGQWSDWTLDSYVIDGSPVQGYLRLKLITLTASADQFELFVPQIWPTGGDWAVPAGTAEDIFQQIGPFLQNPARDALGVFDDDTYFELLDFHHQRLAEIALHLAKNNPWDLLMIETHASDYASHFFLAQADPISGAKPATIERCRRGLARTYESMDMLIGKVLDLADEDTVVAIVSDHGGTPNQHHPVDINAVLAQAGFVSYTKDPQTGKRRVDLSKTSALGIGLVHIFINLKGREPNGIVDPADYEKTQQQIIDVLHAYTDPATGEHPFTLALTRADAEMLNLWGELVGDVVYALKPGYDGAHGKQLPSVSFGIGGQHSTFIMAGAGVRKGVALQRQVRSVNVAPTIAYLLGVPMPANVEGGVVYEALEDPDWPLTEIARLQGK